MLQVTIIGMTTVIFGIASLLLISRARNRLTEGSLKKYLDNFAVCLAFIVIFSIWQTTRSIKGINIQVNELSAYPEYIFIVFGYLAFIFASYRVLKISEEFGFKDDGRRIGKLILEKESQQKEAAKTKKIRTTTKSSSSKRLI